MKIEAKKKYKFDLIWNHSLNKFHIKDYDYTTIYVAEKRYSSPDGKSLIFRPPEKNPLKNYLIDKYNLQPDNLIFNYNFEYRVVAVVEYIEKIMEVKNYAMSSKHVLIYLRNDSIESQNTKLKIL